MSRNQQKATHDQRAAIEEQKEFNKIHKANMCMAFFYFFTYGFIVLMTVAWYLTPTPPKIIEDADNLPNLSSMMSGLLNNIKLNMTGGENKDGLS